MKVALLSKFRDGVHGIPRYAQELTDQMEDARLYRYNAPANNASEDVVDWARPAVPAGSIAAKAVDAPFRLRSVDADVFHAVDPTETPPLRVARRRPIVATIHDLIVYKSPMDFKRSSLYLSRLYLRFVKHFADEVIAISQSTKSDAVDTLGISPDRITVINHGVDDRFSPIPEDELSDELEHPSILMVGVAQPRKNIDGVVRALRRLHDRGIEAHLYLAGNKTDHLDDIEATARSLSIAEYVHVLGRVSDDRLVELYNLADVLTMPSYYEGFGFPVVEAMACGTPVVASDRSSLPEIGGDVPVYVAPDDEASIASGLATVLQDAEFAAELGKKGIARADQFDWSETVRQTSTVYKRAVEKSRP